jgi:hypothetical protein
LHFLEEFPKQLDQDEIIQIFNHTRNVNPVWYEAMVDSNIEIFEISHEKSVSYFKSLENLGKIRRTNGPGPAKLPVDTKNV